MRAYRAERCERVVVGLWTLFVMVALAGGSAAQECPEGEPPSDHFSEPRVVSGEPGEHVVVMDVSLASEDVPATCGVDVGHTVWFQVTPEREGTLVFSTCHPATGYDTVLQAWRTEGDAIVPIEGACSDDAPYAECHNPCAEGVPRGSELRLDVGGGEELLFQVGSFQQNLAGCNLCLGVVVRLEVPLERDCNHNGVEDEVDIAEGRSLDCNESGVPDECDIAAGSAPDCNANGVIDECDLRFGSSVDEDGDGSPDECRDVGEPIVRILEVCPRGEVDWIELYVGSESSLVGYTLTDGETWLYRIPEDVPPLPPGGFVLVRFDGEGAGADDVDPSDGLVVLHSSDRNVLPHERGQASLYAPPDPSSETIRDFVAWGAGPTEAAGDAIAAGLWAATWTVSLDTGSGAELDGSPDTTPLSIGVLPGRLERRPASWGRYRGDDRTPGRPNGLPRVDWSTVEDGARLASDGVALGWAWTGMPAYRLQIDDDPEFRSPLVDAVFDGPRFEPGGELPQGDYRWRVRPEDEQGRRGEWSEPLGVSVQAITTTTAQRVLSMTWLRQRKDTRLLCLDGDDEGNPAAPSPKETWDAPHPDAIFTHGRMNCVRACIAMVATLYGGDLSQDRISYEYLERGGNPIRTFFPATVGNPHDDLGHDRATIICGGQSSGFTLMAWALGMPTSSIHYGGGKPTFAQIRAWIDAGRPIFRNNGGTPVSHETVVAGYRVLSDGSQQLRIFDPWTGKLWEDYDTVAFGCHHVPPAAAPSVQSDEASIAADSDGDHVMDFDETIRFETDPFWADSDEDGVDDRPDIREYVFDTAGSYSLRAADLDQDGARKELDPDNDGDGLADGCEDIDGDGRYEPALGESDNFGNAMPADEFDRREPRNDSFANRTVIPGVVAASLLSPTLSIDGLTHHSATDVDWFEVELAPEIDPATEQEECIDPCVPPCGQASYEPGSVEISISPPFSRDCAIRAAMDLRIHDATGRQLPAVSSRSGLTIRLDCPHAEIGGDRLTFSVRSASGARSFYRLWVHYKRWEDYSPPGGIPPWIYTLPRPPVVKVFPLPDPPDEPLLGPIVRLYPSDPEVIDGWFAGDVTDPLPPEYIVVGTSTPRAFGAFLRTPNGGFLELRLHDAEGAVLAETAALPRGGDGAGAEAMGELFVPFLGPGTYVLAVGPGEFGQDYELLIEASVVPDGEALRRGDCNTDGVVDISDSVFHLNFLFNGGPAPSCLEACAVNEGASQDISDAIYLLQHLFVGGPPPTPPHPDCGPDPEPESGLGCERSSCG